MAAAAGLTTARSHLLYVYGVQERLKIVFIGSQQLAGFGFLRGHRMQKIMDASSPYSAPFIESPGLPGSPPPRPFGPV